MHSKHYNGPQRFNHFLNELETLLKKAARQKNPALWLYKNDARTTLFMLEGLSKLYAGLHNKKKFTTIRLQLKELEDVLGAIDYYDVFAKTLAANKKIPQKLIAYLQAQTREKIQSLDELLSQKQWIDGKQNAVKGIRKTLKKIDWLKDKEEIKAIEAFYTIAIGHIVRFVNSEDFHFENIETDVHELRRKMRWLSIYPHGLLGAIQLSKAKKIPKQLAKYITKQELNSPFNKMPDAGDNRYFVLLEQAHFYSLSWMIAELGRLKDEGLRILIIKEALQQTSSLNDATALKSAYKFIGKGLTIEQLLDKADAVCKTYFREKIPEGLLIGTAAVKHQS